MPGARAVHEIVNEHVSSFDSRIEIGVVPTDEGRVAAYEAAALIRGRQG